MLALITGASRGIGAAAARRLAADGYTVLIHCCRRTDLAQKLAEELHGAAFSADFSDLSQTDALAEAVLSRYGTPDLLINNAAVSVTGLFQEIPDGEAEALFRVNILSMMRLTKRLLPGMIAKKSGCIVNVASVWGEAGASCEVHYSASKAAVIGFTKALAQEVGPSGIRVNCISPGVIDTDMNRMHSAEAMQQLADETPLSRIGTPEEAADAIAFLASDAARFITGQVLSVNGGFHT